ncbi:MAG: amidohydrolase family protein [Planctomycetaceae bacterium]|nr:amidohydrolase family protein [Planctomycetaceae bacterium]
MRIVFCRSQYRGWFGLILAWSSAVVLGTSVSAQDLAIKAGKIITVSGPTIENGIILVRDGRIVEVGQGLSIPVDLRVLDASDKVVMPGIVDPHSSSALNQANERNAVVPFLSVVDGVDPMRPYFEESRRNGVTTAVVVPGNSTMIGGQASIMKTAGLYVDDMLLVRSAGLKLSLQPPSGSRMSHISRLRRELETAKRQLTEAAEAKTTTPPTESTEKPATDPTPKAGNEANESLASDATQDPESSPPADGGNTATAESAAAANQAVKDLLQGKTRAFIYCQSAADVGQAFRLMDDFGFQGILVLGQDCYQAAGEIAKRKVPVILDPTLVFWKQDPLTRTDEKIVLPKLYQEAGVKFLFQANDGDSRQSLGTSYFWFQAATAVRYGWSREDAIAAITLEPAKAMGIDQFVGSIQVGRDADLAILTGDPLDVSTWVEQTLVNGRVVYERRSDWKLKLLMEAQPQ